MAKKGVVSIHGREYKTVALRVSEFREQYTIDDGWLIQSSIVEADSDRVVMRAMIIGPNGPVAFGHAEEVRTSSKINRTSALENCETSAIGRALAAAGFGGDEYASANEVQGAIAHQQAGRSVGMGKKKSSGTDFAAKTREMIESYSGLGDDLSSCVAQVLQAAGVRRLDDLEGRDAHAYVYKQIRQGAEKIKEAQNG